MNHQFVIESMETRRLLAAFSPISLGGERFDSAASVAVLPDSSIVVVGTFSDTVNFDNFGNTGIKTSVGESDVYIARYRANGSLVWVGQIGGESGKGKKKPYYAESQASVADRLNRYSPSKERLGEYATKVRVDSVGYIYVAGSFTGTADLDPTAAGVHNVSSVSDYQDAFLLKVDGEGNLVWAKAWGGRFDDVAKDVQIDSGFSAVVTGYFTRDADLDPTAGTFNVIAEGRDDVFVLRLTAPGGFGWAKIVGGDASRSGERDAAESLSLGSTGDIFLTGTYSQTVDFNPDAGTFNLKSNGKTDAFILKLSSNGTFVFAKSIGGDQYDGGAQIAVGADGFYTAGYFSDLVNLDPGAGRTEFEATQKDEFDIDREEDTTPEMDMYLSKFTLTGDLIWAAEIGGIAFKRISEMAVDAGNNVTLVGAFAGIVDFVPRAGTGYLVSEIGDDFEESGSRDYSYDGFVARYNAFGSLIQARRFGGIDDEFANGAAIDFDTQSTIIVGSYRGTSNLQTNPFRPAATVISDDEREDLFMLTVRDSGDLVVGP